MELRVIEFFEKHPFAKYLCVFLLFSFVVVIFISTFLSDFYDNQIEIVDADNTKLEDIDDKIHKKEQLEGDVFNILLVGVDARGYEEKSRSDTIILASYNKETHSVKLVSFLRDSYVKIPSKGWNKINSATAFGGVGMLINTLNENFNLDIQHYVQIKFDDFKQVIDLMGGLDVELTDAEIKYINKKLHVEDNDYGNDVTAKPGLVHLNGTQTLWHCRNRSVGNSDFERTDRQREVLSLLLDKALNLSASQMSGLVYSMKDYVDLNVPLNLILSLGKDALINKDLTVESYRVPFDGEFSFARKGGASVLMLDMRDTVVKLFNILELELPEDFELRIKQPVPDNKNTSHGEPTDVVNENAVPEDVVIEVPATEDVVIGDFNIEADSEDVSSEEDVTDETVIEEVSPEESTTEDVLEETVVEETTAYNEIENVIVNAGE